MIKIDQIQNLVSEGPPEGKTLEYKKEITIDTESDKKEFLADVSSFANTIGGQLVFGVREDGGLPVELKPMIVDDMDSLKLKIDGIIASGIKPRLKYSLIEVKIGDGYVLLLNVEKGWNPPHRIIFKSWDKFYARNTAGKYPLDTEELRSIFTSSQTLRDRVGNFVDERRLKILSDELPIPMWKGGKLALHLIPLESYSDNFQVDIKKWGFENDLAPIFQNGWSHQRNFEGQLIYTRDADQNTFSYVQLYTNGIIEAVDATLLSHTVDETPSIPSREYEVRLTTALRRYLSFYKKIGINIPILCSLSLCGVRNYMLSTNSYRRSKLNKDHLFLPSTMIEAYQTDSTDIMKSSFDLIWNAFGFDGSRNYDDSGKWK